MEKIREGLRVMEKMKKRARGTAKTGRFGTRILSLLIAAQLLGGAIAVSAAYDTKTDGDYGIIFSENFEGDANQTGDATNFFDTFSMRTNRAINAKDRLAVVDHSGVPGVGSQSLALQKNSSYLWKVLGKKTYVNAASGNTDYDPLTQEGKNTFVCTEFDLYVNNFIEGDEWNDGMIELLNSEQASSGTVAEHNKIVLFRLLFKADERKLYYSAASGNADSQYTELMAYPLKKWQRFRIVQKVTDDNGTVGKLDLYIDGERVLEDYAYVKANTNTVFDMIQFKARNTNTGATSTAKQLIVDNISVYKWSAQAVADGKTQKSVPADTGRLIARVRQYNDLIDGLKNTQIPAEDLEALEDLLEESLDACEDAVGENAADWQEYIDLLVDELDSAFGDIEMTWPAGGSQCLLDYESAPNTVFDNAYKTGYAWQLVPGSGTTTIIDNLPGLILNNSREKSTDSGYFMQEGPDATLVVECDIKFDDLVAEGQECHLRLDSSAPDPDVESGIYFAFQTVFEGAAGRIAFHVNDYSTTKRYYTGLKDGEWYHMRYEIYASDADNAFVGKYSAWVNGEQVVDREGPRSNQYYRFPVIDTFVLRRPTGNNPVVKLDNFSVYKSNQNAPMPLNDGSLLSEIRSAQKQWSEMEPGAKKNALNAAVNRAMTAFESENRTAQTLENAYFNLIQWDEPIYVMTQFKYADPLGAQTDQPVNGGSIQGVYVTKNREVSAGATLILGLYKGGRLESVKTFPVPASIESGENKLIETEFSLPETDIGSYQIKSFIWQNLQNLSPQSSASPAPEALMGTVEISAVPLYDSMSVYIEQSIPVQDCNVYYKTASETTWTQAYSAEFNKRDANYSTSIVDLQEDTDYEIKAELFNGGVLTAAGTAAARTWSSDVPIGQEISIADIYTPGSVLDLTNMKGSPSGWIKIKGDGATVINAGYVNAQSVLCSNTSYVILEDLIIEGGKRYGINLENQCSEIRIINCDISKWSVAGTLGQTDKSTPDNIKVAYFDAAGWQIRGAALRLYECENITVEKCFIHDLVGKTNPWTGSDSESGLSWDFAHPEGPFGVFVQGSGIVLRYNDITGSEKHRVNDNIGSAENFGVGGFISDSDIYGNLLAMANDDGVELDGNGKNVRFHHNRIFSTHSGISTIENHTGPSFVYNNVIHDMRDESDYIEYHTKNGINLGQDTALFGVTHFFYNTFYTEKWERGCGIVSVSGRPYHAVTRNNIVLGGLTNKPQISNAADENSKSSYDYDLLGNYAASDLKGIVSLESGSEREENAIFGVPTFINKDNRDLRLTSGSLGYNSACEIKGFKGNNMGAFDIGSNGIFPARPLAMALSSNYIKLRPGAGAAFSLTSQAGETMGFTVRMNENNSPFTVSCPKTSINEGETLTFTVTAATDIDTTAAYYDGVVFIRFSNGFSLPVCLRIQK